MAADYGELMSKEWFKPDCTRIEAEKILIGGEEGQFVVRFSSVPNSYALSIKNFGSVVHSLISILPMGYCLPEKPQRVFLKLEELLRSKNLNFLASSLQNRSQPPVIEIFMANQASFDLATRQTQRYDNQQDVVALQRHMQQQQQLQAQQIQMQFQEQMRQLQKQHQIQQQQLELQQQQLQRQQQPLKPQTVSRVTSSSPSEYSSQHFVPPLLSQSSNISTSFTTSTSSSPPRNSLRDSSTSFSFSQSPALTAFPPNEEVNPFSRLKEEASVQPTRRSPNTPVRLPIEIVEQALPNYSEDEIIAALQKSHGEPYAAILYLTIQEKNVEKEYGSDVPAPVTVRLTDHFNARSMGDEFHNPALTIFLGHLFVDAERPSPHFIANNWFSLKEIVGAANINIQVEKNVEGILMKTSHPLGQCVDRFAQNFASLWKRDPISFDDSLKLCIGGFQETHRFIHFLHSMITDRLVEFNGSGGIQVAWRIISNAVLSKVHSSLFHIIRMYNRSPDQKKMDCMKRLRVESTSVHEISNLNVASLAVPIQKMDELVNLTTVSAKLSQLASICIDLQKGVRSPLSMNELLSKFRYVLCMSNIENPVSEWMYCRNLCPGFLTEGLEGFALATFEAALQSLE